MKANWEYINVIGMLGYLQGTTHPDISMKVHQCARFNIDPKLSHERAVTRIGRYLLDTKDKGLIFKPDFSKGLECFVDADFAGGWKDSDHSLPETVDIMNAGCPIYWCSKLQTEIALSKTESEYIGLSSAMREVIPLKNLMQEVNKLFSISHKNPFLIALSWRIVTAASRLHIAQSLHQGQITLP